MNSIASKLPSNMAALGVLGHLVIVNKQVHSYQEDVLTEYLQPYGLRIKDTVLEAILNGSDDAESFATSLAAFAEESVAVQEELIYLLYVLSLVDKSFDADENRLISTVISRTRIDEYRIGEIQHCAEDKAKTFVDVNNDVFQRDKPEKKRNVFVRLLRWITQLFRKVFRRRISNTGIDDSYRYRSAVKKCAQIAAEDFSIVKPSYEKVIDACIQTISQIQTYKQELALKPGISAEVAEALGVFIDRLNQNVLAQARLSKCILYQKERTVSDFTISLLGRTKAGKSTLNAILTHQGKNQIGEGMQRTTRYNRVFQWNLLRIIDTPGIGSAEASGRTDEEIAASVLGESDIICFVVVDDSILKDVLEFIEHIAKLNKPIIILLNHKDNIEPEVKFRRFVANPNEWRQTTGERGLQGHMNRIIKYAKDHGFDSLITIHPVFLLAALMSSEPEHKDYSDLLWDSSNVEPFIDQLKEWIIRGGSLKRSQTIVDESCKNMERAMNDIIQAERVLTEQINHLTEQKVKKVDKLKDVAEATKKRIREFLVEEYTRLATDEALVFAEEEYDRKGNLEEDWKEFIKRIDFEQEVGDGISAELTPYRVQVEEVVNELFEDFFFAIKNISIGNNINIPININFKAISKLTGATLGVAGSIILIIAGASNPIGWILTGAGIAFELLSLTFKSQEKKRQQAVNEVYNSLHDGIMKSMDTEIDNTISELNTSLIASITQVDDLFSDLISGLKTSLELSHNLRMVYSEQLKQLNKVYGWRILQFLDEGNEAFSKKTVDRTISEVRRDIPGEIVIVTTEEGSFNAEQLEGIISERVKIEWRH